MKIRFLSDIHNEFFSKEDYFIPEMENEQEQVLVLAGDITTGYRSFKPYERFADFMKDDYYKSVADKSWIDLLCDRFKAVLFVIGNHECYGQRFEDVPKKIQEYTSHLPNFFLLHNNHVEIDDVIFVGGSLWTDYDNGNPVKMFSARQYMADYHKIRQGPNYTKLKPDLILNEHTVTKDIIFKTAKEVDKDVVVITHHSPSYQSNIREYHQNVTCLYHSNLDQEIINHPNIKLWIHGHTHDCVDYHIEQCRIMANCHGYHKMENIPDFDPFKIVEI